MSAEAPLTFTHDTLHSVANQLALIVSYSDLVLGGLPESDPCRADVTEIRGFAMKAATLLGRPLQDA